MGLLYIWHDRYCFKILFDTIPTSAYDMYSSAKTKGYT